ncbi:MAG: type I restriction endonuclease subunit R [Atopobiaceae bacterium]|nr:type I restriction endonuclease subunit R [Atopobiaceae bacterium]
MFDNKVNFGYATINLSMNEDFYEQVIIEHLRDEHGYEYLHGPDVARTTSDYRDVFLPDILPNSLKRINPKLPSVAIEQAILKMSDIEAGGLYQKNEVFNDYLQSGVEVHFYDGKEERDDIVLLLDYNNPENNTFHVVNQWTFVEHSQKRPDVIVFVNGMPLVIFELNRHPVKRQTRLMHIYNCAST